MEAGEASTAASLATLASARLSAEASLAQNYFLLRVADASANLQRATVQAYQRALQITENQLKAGIVTRADVAQAKTQLHNAEVTLTDLAVSRAQYEHAIAILIGKAPADFSLAPATLPETLPSVPALLPADLLERRPDVAAAERKMAAANAQIGVARAAWFPSLKLTAGSSLQNTDLTEWLNAPSRVWSLGATLAETLFDGGQRTAKDRQTHAAYDITVAQYRQTVLGALQEVEDNLVALRVLADEARQQATALAAAREAERLMLNRYKAGTVSYTSVVSTQATANSSERNALQILARRYTASVLLIKALGGGWQGLTQESPPLAFRQPREKPMPAPDGHPS
ncbi:efflux transporter outer membrane subunit [Candidatus Dactylopiibacterium carminicum]|uniref:efflux transporter outer membrane subunit n=1 Tax=Candidatus Dactylopiibacterium carminicum TaxID=857335 RepID=UPI0026B31CEF